MMMDDPSEIEPAFVSVSVTNGKAIVRWQRKFAGP
jgi:hypothetical protein